MVVNPMSSFLFGQKKEEAMADTTSPISFMPMALKNLSKQI